MSGCNRCRGRLRAVVLLALLLPVLTAAAGANSLPRPMVIIQVSEPNDVVCTGMLTAESKHTEWANSGALGEAFDGRLPEGWHLWQARPSGEDFWGSQMPDTFRIALLHEDGTVDVTREIVRTRDMQTFTIQAHTLEVYTTPTLIGLLLQFLTTCSITLAVEGLLLVLFRFPWRENRGVFLLVNLATQAVMTLTFGWSLVNHGGYSAFLAAFLVEFVIVLIELAAYLRLLRGQSRRRRAAYAVAANVASAYIGIYLAAPVYSHISALM